MLSTNPYWGAYIPRLPGAPIVSNLDALYLRHGSSSSLPPHSRPVLPPMLIHGLQQHVSHIPPPSSQLYNSESARTWPAHVTISPPENAIPWCYLRNNLGFCQVCREITAEGLLITSWGSSAAEGGYQISPRRLFHAQTWQKAQIIPIIIYWASHVSMF